MKYGLFNKGDVLYLLTYFKIIQGSPVRSTTIIGGQVRYAPILRISSVIFLREAPMEVKKLRRTGTSWTLLLLLIEGVSL